MLKVDTEVLIIGAGPAGSIAALNLAPFRSVIMVDRLSEPIPRIGESLPSAARPLLADMGLLEEFESQNHYPYYGNQFNWGTNSSIETDFLRDLNGHGWHLNRPHFEKLLRKTARNRGARIISPAKVTSLEQYENCWKVNLLEEKGSFSITAKALIDASGRTAPIARQIGAKRVIIDRLVCGWVIVDDKSELVGLSYIEAVPSGWWYTAPIPNKRRIISFHTDSDLEEAVSARDPKQLIMNVSKTQGLAQIIGNCDLQYQYIYNNGYTAANSAVLTSCVGNAWLATGDAALCFDPISSQGLFNAIYTGLASAEAINRYLDGYEEALVEYKEIISDIWIAYQKNLNQCYALQRKWSNFLFWSRRKRITSKDQK